MEAVTLICYVFPSVYPNFAVAVRLVYALIARCVGTTVRTYGEVALSAFC